MSRFRMAACRAAVLVAILAAAVLPSAAADLPDQLVRFLPEKADLLLVVPSLDDLDGAWAEVQVLAGDLMTGEDEPLPALADLLAQIPAPYNEALDTTRPLAVAATVPNPMTGREMAYWVVLPVLETDADFEGLGQITGMATVLHRKGYLLLSPVADCAESSGPARLLGRLPGGVVRLGVDLQSLWAQFGPMLDFGLAAASAPPPPAEDGSTPPAAMTPEQVEATGRMVRDFFNSADLMGLSLDLKDGELKLVEDFSVLAGSPLDPPAQPDFDQALELTRLLPRDADLVMAYAVDLPGLMDMYKDYYLMSLAPMLEAMGQAGGMSADELLAPVLQGLEATMTPTALALGRRDDRLICQYVLRSDKVREVLALQQQSTELLAGSAPFVKITTVEGLKAEGVEVLGWDYEWDQEAFAAMMGAQAGDAAQMDESMAVAASVFEKFMPGLRMAVRDDLLFASFGRDLDPLKSMIKESKQRRGAPNPELARLAKTVGRDCQGVVYGDLGALMGLVFEVMEEVSGEEMNLPRMSPIPITEALRVGHGVYGVDYSIGLKGILEFVQAMEEMEAQKGQ